MFTSYQKLFAEVMDKEPGINSIWLWSVTIPSALIGYVLCRKKWWFIAFSSPFTILIPLIYYIGCIDEMFDPIVGKAIFSETGYLFYIQFLIAPVIVILSHVLGLIAYQKKLKSSNSKTLAK